MGNSNTIILRRTIEQNKETLNSMLTGSGTCKRLNNLNWLVHELSDCEPRTLFYMKNTQQQPYLDYNCMSNLDTAYRYIIKHPNTEITASEIQKIHAMLCANTFIDGGRLRTTDKVLEIMVDGSRMHAPAAYEVEYRLNEITYNIRHSRKKVLDRAFDAHYELIALQPFDDFNKRTSRIIMNWILINGGYRPIVFNKPSDKQEYRAAIAERANNDTKAYNQYMMKCMIRTQNEIIKLLKKSKIY